MFFSRILTRFLITKGSTRQVSTKTVFALSSGRGKCGVAVIRVSGPKTEFALKSLTKLQELPKPRTAILRSLRHPLSNETLDKGLVIWFPGPNSFTGEHSCEFHVHGGLAVVNSILDALASLPNLTIAEPGEFTRQAFYNKKLDLTEVEGLADLLDAETEYQRKQALLQAQGALSSIYKNWREKLIKAVAHIEAHIDFDETETIDTGIIEQLKKDVRVVCAEIGQHLNDGRKGEILRRGVKTVIIGEPNAGKSSLFNYLCKRPAAIVTPIEGTTRDVLELTLNINGYPLLLADTAGLRDKTIDLIEIEGMKRTIESYELADFIILVVDSQNYLNWLNKNPKQNLNDYLIHYTNTIKLTNFIKSRNFLKPCIIAMNKTDLTNLNRTNKVEENCCYFSCKTEDGAEDLIHLITKNLKKICGDPSKEHPSLNQTRHRQHLLHCQASLLSFLNNRNGDVVLTAQHLRNGLRHLGYLFGVATTENILDVIFKDFCIGK